MYTFLPPSRFDRGLVERLRRSPDARSDPILSPGGKLEYIRPLEDSKTRLDAGFVIVSVGGVGPFPWLECVEGIPGVYRHLPLRFGAGGVAFA